MFQGCFGHKRPSLTDIIYREMAWERFEAALMKPKVARKLLYSADDLFAKLYCE